VTAPKAQSGVAISSVTLSVAALLWTAASSYIAYQRDDTRDLAKDIRTNSVEIARLHGEINTLEREIEWLKRGGEK
jgi:hypothetical protein